MDRSVTGDFDAMPIEREEREEADAVLREMGLTEAELLAMALRRVARSRTLPFAFEPNAETVEAMEELDRGGGKRFATFGDMLADATKDDESG